MSDNIKALLAGFGFILIGAGIGGLIEERSTNPLIKQCEAELPRNQSCKLIAIPDEQRTEKTGK